MNSKASSFSSYSRLGLFLIWMIFIVQQGTSARKLATIPADVPSKSGVHPSPSRRAPSATQGGFPFPTGPNGNEGSSPDPTGETDPSPETTSPSKESSSGSQQNCGYVQRCTPSSYGGESCGTYYTCTATSGQNCQTYTSCTGDNNCSTYTSCGSSSSSNVQCISGTCYPEP